MRTNFIFISWLFETYRDKSKLIAKCINKVIIQTFEPMTANGGGGRAATNFGGTIFRIKVGPGALAREQTLEITGVFAAAEGFEA